MHVIHAFLLVLVPLDWSSRSVGHGKGGGDGLWSLVAKGAAERRHSDDHGRAREAEQERPEDDRLLVGEALGVAVDSRHGGGRVALVNS